MSERSGSLFLGSQNSAGLNTDNKDRGTGERKSDRSERLVTGETDLQRMDREWAEDLVAFNRYKIMRSGYEETKTGNPKLTELRQQAAPLIALGSDLQGPERKLLVECYDKAYNKPALEALLLVKHPHILGQKLNKTQIISKIIDAGVGFPTIQEWATFMEKAETLQRGSGSTQVVVNLDQSVNDNGSGSDDEDKADRDASKATRHTLANDSAATRTRPLQVVKRGGRTDGKTSSDLSFAIDPQALNTPVLTSPTSKVASASGKSRSSTGAKTSNTATSKNRAHHNRASGTSIPGQNHKSPVTRPSGNHSVLNTSRQQV